MRLLQGTLHYCYMSEVSATAPDKSVLVLALFKNNLVITHFFWNSEVILMSRAPKVAKIDMATSLKECPEFSALQSHYEAVSNLHMRSLFEKDPERFDKFR